MKNSTVCVYINAFENEKDVKETVLSVLGQTYKNLKVTVFGITSSSEIPELENINDERLTVLSTKNDKEIYSCLSKFSADFFAFCYAGDIWEKEKIEKQLDFLAGHGDYGACFSTCYIEDINKKEYTFNCGTVAENLYLLSEKPYSLSPSTFIAKSDAINKIGTFGGLISNTEEQKYWFKLLSENKIFVIDEPLVKIKENKNGNFSYKDEIEKLNTQITELQIKLSETAAELETAEYNYKATINSRFWKITAPLRKITGGIKKIKPLRIIFKGFKLLLTSSGRKELKARLKRNKLSKKGLWKLGAKQFEFESSYKFSKDIKFSILVPLYNTPDNFLKEMIKSVTDQTYKNWELCLADGSTDDFAYVGEYCQKLASVDNRIIYKRLDENRGISENTNKCIEMATGEYIVLFDHDDYLHPSALFECMKAICEQNADFIYTDEDKFKTVGGKLFDAHFKPDFAPDNLRSNNYICHLSVFKKDILDQTGGFNKKFDGSQDHDLVLRLTEKAEHIVHIPKILYHWRVSGVSVASDPYAKPYTIQAGRDAVCEQLKRLGLKGTVGSTDIHPNIYRIKYEIENNPKVSIIIPNYNHVEELSRCINSIIEKTTYKNYEIIIVENNSNEETFAYYKTLEKYPQIKTVIYENATEFNFSAINNFGVKFATGDHILLLNNDVEIISPDWLQEMLMFSQRSDVGAVGAMLYYPNDTIQHAGIIIGLLTLAGHAFKHFPRGTGGFFGRAAYAQNLSAVTAACMMIRKDVYETVGGLDETFKVAFNDVDLCMQIRKAGFNIVWTPFAELYHYESISRGVEDTPKKKARFASEVKRFQERWKTELENGDPYYNPNLTLDAEDFSYK